MRKILAVSSMFLCASVFADNGGMAQSSSSSISQGGNGFGGSGGIGYGGAGGVGFGGAGGLGGSSSSVSHGGDGYGGQGGAGGLGGNGYGGNGGLGGMGGAGGIGTGTGGNASNAGNSQSLHFDQVRQSPAVFMGAPMPTAVCQATAGGFLSFIAGAGFAASFTLQQCEVREEARSLVGMGRPDLALRIMCANAKYTSQLEECQR